METLIKYAKKFFSALFIIGAAIMSVAFLGKRSDSDVKTKKDIDAVVHADPKLKPSISEDIASRV